MGAETFNLESRRQRREVNGKDKGEKYDVDDLDVEQSKIDLVVQSGKRPKGKDKLRRMNNTRQGRRHGWVGELPSREIFKIPGSAEKRHKYNTTQIPAASSLIY